MSNKSSGNSMVSKILSVSKNKYINTVSNSEFYNREQESVITDIPLLNVACSSKIDVGLKSGILTVAGESKHFKSMFGLYFVEAFLKKDSENVVVFVDSEFGVPKEYLEKFDLDWDRIVHAPINCVEDLKHELVTQIDAFKSDKKKPKVMFFLDSLGNLASRKELEDALEGKEKADMTRAKSIKSLFRMITVDLKLLDIPMVIINHTYKAQDAPNPKYAPTVVGGGTGAIYSSDYIWIIKRKKEKDGRDVLGYEFNIKIEKGRGIKEESTLPVRVYWDSGIHKWAGFSELAVEFGIVERIKLGRRAGIKFNDMEIDSGIEDSDDEFWNYVLDNSDLADKIYSKYKG